MEIISIPKLSEQDVQRLLSEIPIMDDDQEYELSTLWASTNNICIDNREVILYLRMTNGITKRYLKIMVTLLSTNKIHSFSQPSFCSFSDVSLIERAIAGLSELTKCILTDLGDELISLNTINRTLQRVSSLTEFKQKTDLLSGDLVIIDFGDEREAVELKQIYPDADRNKPLVYLDGQLYNQVEVRNGVGLYKHLGSVNLLTKNE